MTDRPISELRIDPISGRRVYIAEDRAGRPTDYSGIERQLECSVSERDTSNCPFCEGHEGETPPAILEVPGADGHWQVRVIPNKYPAVRQSSSIGGTPVNALGPLVEPPIGAHEVIIETPRHVRDWVDLSAEHLTTILGVYRQRIAEHLDCGNTQQVTLFKNVGYAAGASLEHAHSQLVALPYVTATLETELRKTQQHYRNEGTCAFRELLAKELEEGVRIVAENECFVSFCAFAGRQPYEIWVLPRVDASNFEKLDTEEMPLLAELFLDLLRRLGKVLSPLSYNLVLHTAPAGTEYAESYHWHWELIPRTSQLAGLEWGTGVHVNPLSPERAAAKLRELGP